MQGLLRGLPIGGAICAACVDLGAPISSAQLVQPGSTFNFATSNSGVVAITTIAADGVHRPWNLTNANGTMADIVATESMLPGGSSLISIIVTASANLFPDLGNGQDYGFVNVGAFSNPMDFITPVTLESAVLSFRTASGGIYGPHDFLSIVGNPNPWDGYFVLFNGFAGFRPVHANDVREVRLDLVVFPSPATIVIIAVGAVCGVRTRRASPPALGRGGLNQMSGT